MDDAAPQAALALADDAREARDALAAPLVPEGTVVFGPAPEHAFRAAPMQLVQVYVSADVAREVAGAFGALGCVHFRDLNAGMAQFARRHASELRRLDAAERACAEIAAYTGSDAAAIDASELAAPLLPPAEVRALCDSLVADAARLAELAAARRRLVLQLEELQEERHVLHTSRQIFSPGPPDVPGPGGAGAAARDAEHDEAPLLATGVHADADTRVPYRDDDAESFADPGKAALADTFGGAFGDGAYADPFADPLSNYDNSIISGSILRSRCTALERLCYRATRGNLFFVRHAVPDDEKDVFVVYTHGQASSFKVRQLAESMGSRVLSLTGRDRFARAGQVNAQIEDVRAVLEQTEHTIQLERDLVRGRLPLARAVVAKEKLLYQTLDRFQADDGRAGLLGEGWVPQDLVARVRACLRQVSAQTGEALVVHAVQSQQPPPTFHTTTKVTRAFQAMVDVYGIARSGEVNPGLPTTVTFPFLFAVMFGDAGHGFILFLFAFYLVWNERRLERQPRGEIFDMAYSGRYVLLLMGLFSIFTGFMYNDLFSKPMTLFKSMYTFAPVEDGAQTAGERRDGYTYPFGLDYAWHAAENSLRFTNSYKMKLSVLLGFVHMTYSLMFQLVNARHFGQTVDVWANFVPSFVFMQSIFGYLALAIVYKWTVDWVGTQRAPPSLLNMLIKMFLSPGEIEDPLFPGQKAVQLVLLAAALVCVPWLLLAKPLHWRRHHRSALAGLAAAGVHARAFALDEYADSVADDPFTIGDDDEFDVDSEPEAELGGAHVADDTAPLVDPAPAPAAFAIEDAAPAAAHESFGDVMVHQTIHTIEFCLNCVSHTASYLRLWALSLAHSQLSQVLWNMTLKHAFGPTGAVGVAAVFALFAMWFVVTVLVLVCMEGTSAMLHALRLQWVEAMSKHFEGEGYAFEPFSFRALDPHDPDHK